MRPGYNSWLLAGHSVEVLQSVRDVLGVPLDVGEQLVGDVEVDGVGEGGGGEEFAGVNVEAGEARCSCPGRHDGLFLTPSESRREIHCCMECRLGDVKGSIAGDGVVECLEQRYRGVDMFIRVYEGILR